MEPGFVPLDLHRMLLRRLSALFYADVVLRVLIISGYTLLLIQQVSKE